MRSRPFVVALIIAVVGAACAGSDSTTPVSTTIAVEADDSLATLPLPEPVSTTAAPVASTQAAPATTRAPFEIRSFPDPNWPAVQIPTGPAVTPLAVTEILSDSPGPAYDISPDGNHLALIGTNRLCVAPIDDPVDPTCAEGINPTSFAWSPDSSKVLFNETSFIESRSGPLGALATDGSLVTLAETADPNNPFGGATAAGFVDDDTVVYARLNADDPSVGITYEIHTVGVDGSNDAIIGTLDIGTGTDVFFPESEVFDGTAVYFQPNGLSMQAGAWRFEPESGAIGLVRPVDEDRRFSAHPVDVQSGLLITADGERVGSFTSNRDTARFFTISSIDRSASVVIDDLDSDYMILSAALSPDGSQLAAFEYFRGDDEVVANSEASGRVSITSTASLLRGEPEWTTVSGVGPGAPAVDLEGPSIITWPAPDGVRVRLIDRAFAVDVGAT